MPSSKLGKGYNSVCLPIAIGIVLLCKFYVYKYSTFVKKSAKILKMTADIISIGDELLIGQVINTNASWIAQQLNLAGIGVSRITAISDQKKHIKDALDEASQRSEIILITGGLGPTKDDITKETLCEYFNTRLIFNETVFENIKELFGKRGFNISKLNRKQAEVPENCTPVKNMNGTAPGMWFEKEGKVYISMPGVPFEMKSMVSGYIIPELLKKFDTGAIVHKTVLTQGLPESVLAKKIETWEDNLPYNIKLAYLPQPGIVRLRLSSSGKEKAKLEENINIEIQKLKKIIPDSIFGYDKEQLNEIVGKLLRGKNQTLSTAESCTGGYIAHLITSVAGSSDYFKGSVVSYANEIKENILGVQRESLIEYGAVSEQVAIEMAEGVKRKLNTDYAIAVTGIAGPGGGTLEKSVGTAWIAIATPQKTIVKHFQMGEHRERNIRRTALTALGMLRKKLIR